jgi:hypothetical protein
VTFGSPTRRGILRLLARNLLFLGFTLSLGLHLWRRRRVASTEAASG